MLRIIAINKLHQTKLSTFKKKFSFFLIRLLLHFESNIAFDRRYSHRDFSQRLHIPTFPEVWRIKYVRDTFIGNLLWSTPFKDTPTAETLRSWMDVKNLKDSYSLLLIYEYKKQKEPSDLGIGVGLVFDWCLGIGVRSVDPW